MPGLAGLSADGNEGCLPYSLQTKIWLLILREPALDVNLPYCKYPNVCQSLASNILS